jgi:hypothetical protein
LARSNVTTAKPGHLHIFDISKDAAKPQLIKSIATAEGAHHVAFTKDEKLAFVQNSLLNLPGMSDGSITIVDLVKGQAIDERARPSWKPYTMTRFCRCSPQSL